MKQTILVLLCVFGLASCGSAQETDMKSIDNQTVSSLDLSKFVGQWYEIARYDHKFEKGMSNVSATYSIGENGKIAVLNEGMRDGKAKSIKGKAKQPDPNDPGKLKVSFFLWFYSDYYVLYADPEYKYLLVGSSTDKYLWIMSREKSVPEDVMAGLLADLQSRGYDTDRLLFVEQD